MRLTERELRTSVRRVMREAFGFTSGIEDSDMPLFEKLWSKIMDIVDDLEVLLVENNLDDVLEGARQVRDDLVRQHGNIVFNPDRYPGSDLLQNTEYFARDMMRHIPVYAPKLKQIDNLLVLMHRMLMKKSLKLDHESSGFAVDRILTDFQYYVGRMITRYVSALAVERLTGEEMPGWTVTARNNPRFSLNKMLENAVYWATI